MKSILFVFAGGGIGSALRYTISLGVNKMIQTKFPLSTFIVNITGCFLIGLFLGYWQKQGNTDSVWYVFLVTGICGGYTTFSAFSAENIKLIQNGEMVTAMLYIGSSLLTGILATMLGLILTRG